MTAQRRLFATRRTSGKRASIEEQIESAGIWEPETEYRFASSLGRQWRFDFAWPTVKVALEVEGATFGKVETTADGRKVRTAGGRHSTGAGLEADAYKYNRAAMLGWMVIRVTTTMVRKGQAIPELLDAFAARGVRIDSPSAVAR